MRISVFSRGPNLYSTSRIVEAGRERGHQMEVIDYGYLSPYLDGGRPGLLLDGQPTKALHVVIPRIGTNMTLRGTALLRQLQAMGIPSTMSSAALQLARDKMGSLQALAAAGLDVPDTVLCFSLREARLAALRLGGYPIVVKMLESTHGVGVSLAHNLYQLERIAESYLHLQGRFVMQEYVAESEGRDVRAFVVGGRVVGAMERRASVGEFRANMHRGATAVPIGLSAKDERTVLSAARVLGVEIAGVDLIPSRHGYLLMEVNASPGLEGIETTTKQDIAGAIIDYAVDKTKP